MNFITNLSTFRNVRMFKGRLILLFILFLSNHLGYVGNAQVDNTVSTPKCDHLVSDDGQHNAYFHNHKLCCMCPAGSYLLDHCGEDSPDSTLCKECHYNETDPNDRYHIPYGPHMVTKCERQFPVFCQRDEISVEGSTSRRPKCISKPNEVRTKTTTTMATTTENSLLTRILQPVNGGNDTESNLDIEHATSDGQNQGSQWESDDTKFKYTKSQGSSSITHGFKMTTPPSLSTMQDNQTTAKHGRNKYAMGSWPLITTIFLGVVCLVSLILYFWRKNKKKKRIERQIQLEQVLMNSKADGVHIVGDHVQAESNRSVEAGPQQINAHHGNAVPETQPIITTDEREDGTRNDGQVSDTGEEVEDNQPLLGPVNNRINSSYQQTGISKRNQDTNYKLIMEIATIFPECISRTDVLPIFRCMLGLEAESYFEDMDAKYENDTPEFIVKLMLHCTRVLGKEFTPEFILQSLRKMPRNRRPGSLIERIEEIISKNPVQ